MTDQQQPRRVSYQHTIEYEIVNSPDLFSLKNLALLSGGRVENARRFVVIDSNVQKHYESEICNYFASHQIEVRVVPFPGGEEYKTLESYLSIAKALDDFPIHRRDEPVIAIGGGVLTDVVGFVASSYRRGLPYIKVPTTLMGYVDASIGIKTGINFNNNKNRLGAFIPPLKVLLDRSLLKTLPHRHILNGTCEIIKLAVIKDAELFYLLEEQGVKSVEAHYQNEAGRVILDRAINGMIEELEDNLLEEELARKVDFGHTFSYGLETKPETQLLHGEAVLLDVVLSTMIALGRKLISENEADRLFQLINNLGISLDISVLEINLLWQTLQERVYHRNGLQRAPLPNGIGNCVFVNDVRLEEITAAVNGMVERTGCEAWHPIKMSMIGK
jgi:3-dehydroquinate synthetase